MRPSNSAAMSVALKPAILASVLSCCLAAPSRAGDGAANRLWLMDYMHLPFASDLFTVSWGSSSGQSPAEMFWFKGDHYSDPVVMSEAQRAAGNIRRSGRVPMAGLQRWEDTFVRSLPSSRFPGAPPWVDGSYAHIPEFATWARWTERHPQYLDTDRDGGSVPPEYRAWHGMHGNINPLMPLDRADIPAGMRGRTYGDLIAFRWAELAVERAGASGIGLSDFTDSLPHTPTSEHDFNPRLIDAFEKATGLSVPDGTVPERAEFIVTHHYNAWTDFWCQGWASFFAALLREIGARTTEKPLVIEQAAFSPSTSRTRALDPRIVRQRIGADSIIYDIDAMTMSPERRGTAMVEATRVNGTYAAYEPDARFGANLSSDDDLFWRGADLHWADLAPAERHARGLGELKRLWLENGWLQVADRAGHVRRGLAFVQRSYWDGGKVADDVLQALRSIVPARPFGPALYYSAEIGRLRENDLGRLHLPEGDNYFSSDDQAYAALRDGAGIASGYFVSDAALPALTPAARPAAWIVLERFDPRTGADLLPPAELAALQRTAPVLSSMDEISRFPMPLSYSPGVTGIGFYARDGALIVTASNTRGTPQDAEVVLRTLPGGKAEVRALFTPQRFPLAIASGNARFRVHLAPWNTEVFRISFARQ